MFAGSLVLLAFLCASTRSAGSSILAHKGRGRTPPGGVGPDRYKCPATPPSKGAMGRHRPPAGSSCTPAYDEHVLKAPPGHISVAWDRLNRKNKLGKGFLSFATADAFLAWYAARTPRCCYEFLRTVSPICVGFDIDCTFGKAAQKA